MLWIKSGIENPSKSEVIGRCGGNEKKRMIMQNRQNPPKHTKKNVIFKQDLRLIINFKTIANISDIVLYITISLH